MAVSYEHRVAPGDAMTSLHQCRSRDILLDYSMYYKSLTL